MTVNGPAPRDMLRPGEPPCDSAQVLCRGNSLLANRAAVRYNEGTGESSLVVEHRLPKPRAAGSNPVSRSIVVLRMPA